MLADIRFTSTAVFAVNPHISKRQKLSIPKKLVLRALSADIESHAFPARQGMSKQMNAVALFGIGLAATAIATATNCLGFNRLSVTLAPTKQPAFFAK